VRERSGIDIVDRISGKTAVQVLDPTLLLTGEEWTELSKHASDRAKHFRGILCYVMPGDRLVTSKIEENAQFIKRMTGLPIMRLGLKEYEVRKYKTDEIDIFASPCDFVAYFLNAQYIVTNSFHGTAFGLNFGKHIVVPYNSTLNKDMAIHERIMSLLETLDSLNVLLSNEMILDELPTRDIERTNERLRYEREKSIKFLRESLLGDN
jgi:hypothetical protein